MVWTDITRPQYERKTGRYSSDCSEKEGHLIEPFLPPEKPIGRPRTARMREVWCAIQHMASTGCQWKMIPNDFPRSSTILRYFYDWRDNGILHQINHAMVMVAREKGGREVSPSAGVIDSQSVKTTQSGGICRFDAGKKIRGRKHHIITDTIGFPIGFVIHTADIQDRGGAVHVFNSIRRTHSWLRQVFAPIGEWMEVMRDQS